METSVLRSIWHRHHRQAPHAQPTQFADVSNYQGDPDWDSYAAAGYQRAVCKATEGTNWTDAKMASNRAALDNLGLEVGLYHFAGSSGNKTIADPTTEANFFLNTVGPMADNEYPILDFELPYNLTPAQQASWISTWCTTVQNRTGKVPTLYSGQTMLSKMDTSSLGKYPLWIASYPSNPNPNSPPTVKGWSHVTAWQYTDTATVPGISGQCDESYLYSSTASDRGRHHHPHRRF